MTANATHFQTDWEVYENLCERSGSGPMGQAMETDGPLGRKHNGQSGPGDSNVDLSGSIVYAILSEAFSENRPLSFL